MQGRIARCTLVLLALALATPAMAVRVDWAAGIGVEHNDNVNLAEEGAVSEDILRPSLAFRVEEQGSRVRALVEGLLEYRDYLGNRFADELAGQLAGRVDWNVLPGRLDLVFEDYLGEQPVNRLAPPGPGNRQRTNVFAFGPTLRLRPGQATQALLEARLVDSRASRTDAFDSRRLVAGAALVREFSPAAQGGLHLEAARIRVGDHASGGPDYDRHFAWARGAWERPRLQAGLDLGWGWLRADPPLGNHSRAMVRASLGWQATPAGTLTVRGWNGFSDAASDMLGLVEIRMDRAFQAAPAARREPLPSTITIGRSVISARPYLSRRLELDWNYQAATWAWGITPWHERLDYLGVAFEADQDQRSQGVYAFANRQLRPRWMAGVFASGERVRYLASHRRDRDRAAGLYLLHHWTRHWAWRLEYSRYERRSTQPGQGADQNIVFLGITWTR